VHDSAYVAMVQLAGGAVHQADELPTGALLRHSLGTGTIRCSPATREGALRIACTCCAPGVCSSQSVRGPLAAVVPRDQLLSVDDIDLFEVHGGFATQVLAVVGYKITECMLHRPIGSGRPSLDACPA
jgi:hypothetical protein